MGSMDITHFEPSPVPPALLITGIALAVIGLLLIMKPGRTRKIGTVVVAVGIATGFSIGTFMANGMDDKMRNGAFFAEFRKEYGGVTPILFTDLHEQLKDKGSVNTELHLPDGEKGEVRITLAGDRIEVIRVDTPPVASLQLKDGSVIDVEVTRNDGDFALRQVGD